MSRMFGAEEFVKRLVPGFVTDCKLVGDWRTVSFANGMVVREFIVVNGRKSPAFLVRSR